MTDTRAMLAELPDPDKLVAFDRNRNVMVTMAENVEKATRPQLQELVQLLVERVQAKERSVDPESIEWTPPARPFYGVFGGGAPGRARGANCQTRGEAGGVPVAAPTHKNARYTSRLVASQCLFSTYHSQNDMVRGQNGTASRKQPRIIPSPPALSASPLKAKLATTAAAGMTT